MTINYASLMQHYTKNLQYYCSNTAALLYVGYQLKSTYDEQEDIDLFSSHLPQTTRQITNNYAVNEYATTNSSAKLFSWLFDCCYYASDDFKHKFSFAKFDLLKLFLLNSMQRKSNLQVEDKQLDNEFIQQINKLAVDFLLIEHEYGNIYKFFAYKFTIMIGIDKAYRSVITVPERRMNLIANGLLLPAIFNHFKDILLHLLLSISIHNRKKLYLKVFTDEFMHTHAELYNDDKRSAHAFTNQYLERAIKLENIPFVLTFDNLAPLNKKDYADLYSRLDNIVEKDLSAELNKFFFRKKISAYLNKDKKTKSEVKKQLEFLAAIASSLVADLPVHIKLDVNSYVVNGNKRFRKKCSSFAANNEKVFRKQCSSLFNLYLTRKRYPAVNHAYYADKESTGLETEVEQKKNDVVAKHPIIVTENFSSDEAEYKCMHICAIA